jgi:hypothetical protein
MQLEPFKHRPRVTPVERFLFWCVIVPIALTGLFAIAGAVYMLGFEHY